MSVVKTQTFLQSIYLSFSAENGTLLTTHGLPSFKTLDRIGWHVERNRLIDPWGQLGNSGTAERAH